MAEFTKDNSSNFRKRVVGMILATDMARHNQDLPAFKLLLE